MKRRQFARKRAASGDREGFTLVELMVAIIIFSIGILGLASTSAVVVKQMGDSGRMGLASATAQSRIERLRLANCKTAQTGTITTQGVAESWTVTPATRSAEIQVTVTYTTRNGARSQAYRSTVPCV